MFARHRLLSQPSTRGEAATLVARLVERTDRTVALRTGAVLFVTALTAAAAQLSVPLPWTPVPFTMQPMVVLLGGAALGARYGLLSQLLYLAAGIAGLPAFAWSPALPQGVARLMGPTGGYLMSYPLAAFVVGHLAERGFDRRYFTAIVAMSAGLAVIFAGGVLWLGLLDRGAQGLDAALRAGLYPFLLADVVKVFIAAAVLPALWRLTGRASRTGALKSPPTETAAKSSTRLS